jgi:6,7-dimethyl-8-ribityllumazine synthase
MANNHPVKIAIVVSRFNHNITSGLHSQAIEYFEQHKSKEDTCDTFWVPGAVEIPIITQLLARKSTYSVIVCLGAVIRGETDHYDYVCQQVSNGIQRVSLDFNIPVIFGIVTTDTLEQALARANGDPQNHKNRGKEAMEAALEMATLVKEL